MGGWIVTEYMFNILYVELFAENNNLTQLLKETTYFSKVEEHCQNVLDLFMTSNPEKYEVHDLALLGNSDHMTKFF